MKINSLIFLLLTVIIAGCSTGKLTTEASKGIKEISIISDSTINIDGPWKPQVIDLHFNRNIAEAMNKVVSEELKAKGFLLTGSLITVGAPGFKSEYLIIEKESDRELDFTNLTKKMPPFLISGNSENNLAYNDNLQKLINAALFKSSAPTIKGLGLQGDAVLVAYTEGFIQTKNIKDIKDKNSEMKAAMKAAMNTVDVALTTLSVIGVIASGGRGKIYTGSGFEEKTKMPAENFYRTWFALIDLKTGKLLWRGNTKRFGHSTIGPVFAEARSLLKDEIPSK